MTLYMRPGGGVIDDQQEQVPAGAIQVGRVVNPYQYNQEESSAAFQWAPEGPLSGAKFRLPQSELYYGTKLLTLADKAQQGQLTKPEQQEWEQMRAAAMAVPMRDPEVLAPGGYRFYGEDVPQAARLDPSSPDLGAFLLTMRDKVAQGTATQREQELYNDTRQHLAWQHREASDPLRDGSAFGLSNPLMMALLPISIGTGMAGLAPLAAGTLTAGSLGAAGSTLGSIANLIGPATGQDWLTKAGLGLGLTGTLASLPSMLTKGVTSLGDAARLAQAAGKVTGTVGQLSGNETLGDIGTYLGAAGQLGSGTQTLSDVLGSGVTNLTDAARLASGLGQMTSAVGRVTGNRPLQQVSSLLGLGERLGGNVGNLLGASQQAQQRGTRPPAAPGAPVARTMTDEDWLRWTGQPGPWQPPGSVLGNL